MSQFSKFSIGYRIIIIYREKLIAYFPWRWVPSLTFAHACTSRTNSRVVCKLNHTLIGLEQITGLCNFNLYNFTILIWQRVKNWALIYFGKENEKKKIIDLTLVKAIIKIYNFHDAKFFYCETVTQYWNN